MRKYQVRFRGGITEKEHSYLAGILPDTTDGRKLALDQRLLNPALPDDPGSKANACADKVYEIWAQTRERRSTQLIFSDLATPGTGAWNVYDDIRDKLIARGVPKEEIAYIHDANTDAKKAALFARVRAGKVRVLLGSTQKMGAGTNVQTKLIALHHLDVPWRPSDIEQREGRILRQGNENKRVQIFRYATEGSFDAYSWQLIENKQRYISQIMTSKTPARSCEDLDEATLTYAEVKALCAGNPLIKEKMDLDNEVARLSTLRSAHNAQIYELQDLVSIGYPAAIRRIGQELDALRQDAALFQSSLRKDDKGNEMFSAVIQGVTYTKRADADAALLEACKAAAAGAGEKKIGRYCGFDICVGYDPKIIGFAGYLQGEQRYRIELNPKQNFSSFRAVLENICSRLCSTVRTLPRLNTKASWPPTAKKGNIATRMPSCTPASLTPETRHKHKAPGRKGPAWGVFYKEKSMFIKLYNALFDFGLKPKELKVYVYLSACQNCLGTATVRSATVQERCGMSEHTVRTAIAGLAQKGLVTVCPRRDRNGQQIAHAYKLRYLSGGWCRLPLDALSLPARDFAVYAYLCRCANRLRKAFPSFTHMANALRVAVTTVQTAIKNLAAAGLLLKAAFRAGKHNLYILVDAKKEAACGQTQTAVHKAHKNKITIPFLGRACQMLGRFFGDAVCQILRSSNKTNPTYSTEGRTISPSRRILTGEVRPAQPECKGRSVPLAGQELIGGARRYFFLCTALQSLWQAAIIWDRRMQNDDGGNQIQAGGEGVPVRRAGGLQGQAADQARQSGPCPRKRREEKGAVPRSSGG